MKRLLLTFELYLYYRRRNFTVANALRFAWGATK